MVISLVQGGIERWSRLQPYSPEGGQSACESPWRQPGDESPQGWQCPSFLWTQGTWRQLMEWRISSWGPSRPQRQLYITLHGYCITLGWSDTSSAWLSAHCDASQCASSFCQFSISVSYSGDLHAGQLSWAVWGVRCIPGTCWGPLFSYYGASLECAPSSSFPQFGTSVFYSGDLCPCLRC